MAILKEYLNKKYDTPQCLKNKHAGKTALIIGTGSSTSGILPFKDQIRNNFDFVIGLNYATKNFEDVMDYRLIVEKKADGFVKDLLGRDYRKDLPHIINWKSIDQYPKDIPLIKTTRSNFDFRPNINEYNWNKSEGLLIGPVDSVGLSAGTVTCQAIHLACIMGAKKIYTIGADLMFAGDSHHYYGGQYYKDSKTKQANRSPMISVSFGGEMINTTEFFYNSAKFIDKVITDYCSPNNIEIYDFSNGMITMAKKVDILGFFAGV